MRIGISLDYSGGFQQAVAELADYEKAGLDTVFVAEAYSFDSVSQLGYIAAKTEKVQIASGIFTIYSRTPSLLAMTAAGLDHVSGGRFMMGLGASGPQVIEGFHGVPYDAPLGRTREVVDICRMVWRREPVIHDGKHYQLPLPADQGTGLGKPLKLINHPVRSRIPIFIASIGPRNVELTAEIAEGWEPIFFLPEKAGEVWGEPLAAGKAKRDPELNELETIVQAPMAITEDDDVTTALLDMVRPQAALYIGGMGARDKNFYNQLFRRYGYEKEAAEIQDLYLDGKKAEAAALVPEDALRKINLIGQEGEVRERFAALREAGVTTVNVMPMGGNAAERTRLIETAKELSAG